MNVCLSVSDTQTAGASEHCILNQGHPQMVTGAVIFSLEKFVNLNRPIIRRSVKRPTGPG